MNRYSDEDLKKARTLINDHAGIHKNDLETTLDLIGPELDIYPQKIVPDTSHITEKAFDDLMDKNLEMPTEIMSPRGEAPKVRDIETISVSMRI